MLRSLGEFLGVLSLELLRVSSPLGLLFSSLAAFLSFGRYAATVANMAPPNQRLKLTARGGRLMGKESVLIAAAAGRSLSAIR
jgi:hypothetical protein